MQKVKLAQAAGATTYPGRGIVAGRSQDGSKALLAYFIMGRSVNSRNRIFVEEGDGLRTQAFDPSAMEDPSLIIYSPVRVLGKDTIFTNGDQTDTMYDFMARGDTAEAALRTREFEPDAPNYTPRISALLTFGKTFSYKMNILKSADAEGSACNRYNFAYAPMAGLGHFIHTYVCDGNPIPTFQGEPERMEVLNDIDAMTEALWTNLDENNKISLYVRYTDLQTGEFEDRLLNKNC